MSEFLTHWYDQNKTTDDLEVIPWSYKTDIPHESFYAKYSGEPCCDGFVFRIEDFKNYDEGKNLCSYRTKSRTEKAEQKIT